MLFRIQFPNPYGAQLPRLERVQALQETYGFSDQLADFLLTQNGFRPLKMEEDPDRDMYIVDEVIEGEGDEGDFCQDFQLLYSMGVETDHYDLEKILSYSPLLELFFPIGSDCAGNEFVEILTGSYKGYIACIDHDSSLAPEDLDDYAMQVFDEESFAELSPEEQIDALTDRAIGPVALQAPSLKVFVEECLHLDAEFMGYVRYMALAENSDETA